MHGETHVYDGKGQSGQMPWCGNAGSSLYQPSSGEHQLYDTTCMPIRDREIPGLVGSLKTQEEKKERCDTGGACRGD